MTILEAIEYLREGKTVIYRFVDADNIEVTLDFSPDDLLDDAWEIVE